MWEITPNDGRKSIIFTGTLVEAIEKGKELGACKIKRAEATPSVLPTGEGKTFVCGKCTKVEGGKRIEVRHASMAEVRACYGAPEVPFSSQKWDRRKFTSLPEAMAYGKAHGGTVKKDGTSWVWFRLSNS